MSYTASEKLAIVKYAEAHSNRAAGRRYDSVSESNIRLWRQQKERLEKMPRAKKNNRGRPPVFPEMVSKLMEWIADRWQQGIGISIVEVRLQAKLMAKLEPSAASFKASYSWARRFMERNDLSVRRRTTLTQRLPADHDAKLLEFQQFVIQLLRQHGYDLSQITHH